MRPEEDLRTLAAPVAGSALSRRRALQLSAAGLAVGLTVGCAPAAPEGPAVPADWTSADLPLQRGRRVLITGANGYPRDGMSGLGYHAALDLVRAGAAVIIASRNQALGDEAVRRVRAAVPAASIAFRRLDLADLSSVAAFTAGMRDAGEGLDVLINNAGVMGRLQREASVDGFERCFATNILGHFALTAGLLPLLRQGQAPRIVWVSSLRGADGDLDFRDLQLQQDYDYVNAYDQTKLAMLMTALEAQRRSTAAGWGITSMAAHPGVARTRIVLDGPGPDSTEGFRFRNLPFMFRDPAQRVHSTLYAAAAPQAVGGHYYGPSGLAGVLGSPGLTRIPEAADSRAVAGRLWTTLETLGRTLFA